VKSATSNRVLATTGVERSEFLPEVPTMTEAGYRDVVVQSWLGFPESMRKFGMRAQTSGPAAFGATLQSDLERWAPIVKAPGFTAED
jgi:tripartite-type tricarboxylate transporter receptor subunit TctC